MSFGISTCRYCSVSLRLVTLAKYDHSLSCSAGSRLYSVLNRRLAHVAFLAEEYSIADIATYPWVARHEWHKVALADFPHVKRWFDAVGKRPAVKRGAAVGADLMDMAKTMSDEDKKRLFKLTDQHFKKK